MRTKKIFKRSLAIELMRRGNTLLSIERNQSNPGESVHFFKDSLKLRDDIHSIQLTEFHRKTAKKRS